MRTGIEILDLLDNFLKTKGISRRQFSAMNDIPYSSLGNWKTKNSAPSLEHLVKIAKFMDVSLDWLITGKEYNSDNLNVTKKS